MLTPHHRRAAVLLCTAAATAVSLPAPLARAAAKVYNPTNPSDVWNLDANWGVLSGGAGSSVIPNQGVPTATDSNGDSADFRLEGIPAPLQTGPISVDTVADQSVTSLRFQGTALPTGGSYSINNNTITLYGLSNGNGVVYQITSPVTINSNLLITKDQFFFSGGAGGAGITYAGAIGETGGPFQLTRNQSGIATFSNPNNSFTGGLVITEGTLRATSDGALGAPYDGTLSRLNVQTAGSGYTAAPTISFSGGGGSGAAGTATLSGAAVGSFNLTSPGSGYTSLPTITTSAGSAKAFATLKGQVTIKTGGTLTLSGSFDSNRPILLGSNASGFGAINTASNNTLTGVLSNANGFAVASLTKQGAGTLTLTAANLYNGGTTVSNGTLRINSDAALGVPYDGSLVGIFATTAGSGYSTPTSVSITGGGGSGATATVTLSSGGLNNFTVTNAGTGYVFPPTVTVTGGSGSGAVIVPYVKGLLTLKAGATLQTTAPLTSNRAVVLAAGTGPSTIDTNGFDSTFTGVFNNGPSGTGSLAKAGAGTLTLSGINTYTGLTTVAAGTLLLSPPAWAPVLSPAGADVQTGARLVLDYTATSSPASSLFAQLAAGLIHSTTADATHALGLLDDPDSSTVTVAYTLLGDANLDGTLDADDFALLDRGYARSLPGWSNGDFNYSGSITPDDYLLLDSTYAQTHPLSPAFLSTREQQFGAAYVSTLLATVPEPTSLLAACGLALPFLRRRRQHR